MSVPEGVRAGAARGGVGTWTVLRLILWSAEYLSERGVESARLDAEHLLERLDLVTDRGLGDVQLLGRLGEREMARRGLEGAQAVERGEAPGHAIIGLEIIIRDMR